MCVSGCLVVDKSGLEATDAPSLVDYIRNSCSNLHFIGLMTIGAFDHDLTNGPNPDFQRLLRCRQHVCEQLAIDAAQIELSMGMSGDFEHAVSSVCTLILS